MISYMCSVFKRFLLFQFFFVFAYYKFLDVSKSSYEFKDRFYELSKLISFKNTQVDLLFNNPIPVFQAFIGIQLVSALFAVLGSRLFSFISGIFLLLTSLIYYSPFKTKSAGASANISFETCSIEFLLSIALVLAIFAQSFSSSYCKKSNQDVVETEQETVKPKQEKRESKPSSKGKKKHI
jgi:hypothetical protein